MSRRTPDSRAQARPVAVALLVLLLSSAASAQDRLKVAILPMVVHATTDREYLRSGLADMLASRLGGEYGIGVMRLDDPDIATTHAEPAREAGRNAGAD